MSGALYNVLCASNAFKCLLILIFDPVYSVKALLNYRVANILTSIQKRF